MFDPVITTQPLISGGKLKPLGIAAPARAAQLPQVKTLAELGAPGVDASVWFGAVVKAGTPQPVVDKLNAAFVQALKSPDVIKRFADQGLQTMPSTPQQFGVFMKDEVGRWGALVKASGATMD
jgi:tripartite-type tricarboxylate transporter receptor subunit TctC